MKHHSFRRTPLTEFLQKIYGSREGQAAFPIPRKNQTDIWSDAVKSAVAASEGDWPVFGKPEMIVVDPASCTPVSQLLFDCLQHKTRNQEK